MCGSLTTMFSRVLFMMICMANLSDSALELGCIDFPDLPADIQISENTPVGTIIFSMNSTPRYFISYEPTYGSEYFNITDEYPQTDLVTIAPIDDIIQDSFILIFMTEDYPPSRRKRSLETLCYVNITVMRAKAPVFPKEVYYIQVYEGEAGTNLTVVTTNVTNPDGNDVITFSILTGCSPFLIDPQSALLSYAYDYNIDENFHPEVVVVTLEATDSYGQSAEAFLVVTILNINDNEPQFSVTDVTVHLSSLTPRNADIFNMPATDADGDELMYTLVEAEKQVYFQVNEGKVKLTSELDTDETMILHVIASDGLWESTATVTVSIIPNNSNTTLSAQTSKGASNDNSCSTSTASLSWSIPLTLALGTAALLGFIALLRKKKKGEEKDGNKVNPIDDDPIPDVA